MVQPWQTSNVRKYFWEKQGGYCALRYSCCKFADQPSSTWETSTWTIDHINDQKHYPDQANDPNNWQGVCRSCNAAKGAHRIQSAPRTMNSYKH